MKKLHCLAGIGASILLCAVSSAGVIYVDATGNGNYTSIQPAIDMSAPGDVILVRAGQYEGFVLDMRSLSIVADVGAVVKVNGTVTVNNTVAADHILLAGFDIEGTMVYPVSRPGIEIIDNAGHVRIQDCNVKGGPGHPDGLKGGDGGEAALIANNPRVAFSGCSLTGGEGYGIALFLIYGGNGGHGVVEQGSAVALYDCVVRGGAGGDADYAYPNYEAGDGGDACQVLDFGILASNCQFDGGWGGGQAQVPGNGGDGLVVLAAQAQLVGSILTGGMGGYSYWGTMGIPGQPQSGAGTFNFHPGSARTLSTAELVAEGAAIDFDLSGDPGDRFWLLGSAAPGFTYSPAVAGILLVPTPFFFSLRRLSLLPASGAATVSIPAPRLASGVATMSRFFQGIVLSSGGVWRLASPAHQIVINCSEVQPDCNANGSNDSCDILRVTSVDCDANGVPDECQPDCNMNGIADPCDITSGFSLDENQNGIPDECEGQNTWVVDAAAAAGGNGSVSAPFQTIGEAFAQAVAGDAIVVADGLYVGPGNRELTFGGRELVLRSASGPGACVIDCESLGRAFVIEGTTNAARVSGFTIRNGRAPTVPGPGQFKGGAIWVENAHPVIADCIFESCTALSNGGAIALSRSSSLVRDCSFDGCSSGPGGAVWAGSFFGTPRFLRCMFTNNQGSTGGALYSSNSQAVFFESCVFLGNTAISDGGAVSSATTDMFLDQCIFAGNSGKRGGVLADYQSNWELTNCTLVDNTATTSAGAAYFSQANLQATSTWRNNVLWNNTAPNNAQVELRWGTLDVASCDVEGGQAAVIVNAGGALVWGAGNFHLPPQFVDPDGPDNDPSTLADNDYRLGPNSPALDAGDNASVAPDRFDLDGDGNLTEPVPLDLDGNTRFIEIPSAPNTGMGVPPLVDLGPWECQR